MSYSHSHEATMLLVASYFEQELEFMSGVCIDDHSIEIGKDYLLALRQLNIVYFLLNSDFGCALMILEVNKIYSAIALTTCT